MVAVIGDVHGCFFTLGELYKKVREKYSDIEIYCVGDLIDRGNFSYEVVEFVIEKKIVFTPGNHDYMFYYYFKEPLHPMGRSWMYNGAESTLRSYENRINKIGEHLEAISKAPLYINNNDCFISHAGISEYYKEKLPKDFLNSKEYLEKLLKTDIYSERGILWNRDRLMNIEKLQVVGHTRQQEVHHDKNKMVFYVDTAAVAGNKLTAAIIEKDDVKDILSVDTILEDISQLSK